MPSEELHATFHATFHPKWQVPSIRHHRGDPAASRRGQTPAAEVSAHLINMSNHTITGPITTWAELRSTDREVLTRNEVATLLTIDPRTVDHAIEDGTIPAVHVGRRVLIPRRPFLRTFGVDDEASA